MILRVLLAIAALVLYAVAGRTILKLLKMPTTLRSMAIFVFSGPAVGFLALVVQVTVIAEREGHIGHEPHMLNMFAISLVVALLVSVVAVKWFGDKS